MNIKTSKRWIILAVIVLLIAGGYYKHVKNRKLPESKVVKNVTVKKVTLGSISTEVEYPSKLVPAQEITVVPKIAGKVSTIEAHVGDMVKKGQTLFTLDTTELTTQLRQQQALLDSANSSLIRTEGTAVDQQISSAEQILQKAQIAYDNAKDNLNKTQQLYDAGAVSKQQLDDASTAADSAAIDLKTAEDSYNATKDKIAPQSVDGAKAQVEQSKAAVDYIQDQINDGTVTSPIDGIVSERSIDVGEMASSAAACYTVIDTSSLTADVNVADTVLPSIKEGQTVSVIINALSDKAFTGTIDNISPNSDSKNNTYKVKIKIDNANASIKPGMFAKIALPSEQKSNILTVPNEAIKIENGVRYLYIVDKNKVKKIAVTTGISDGKVTEVSGDVKEGDNVITEGQDLLNDGEQVNVVK